MGELQRTGIDRRKVQVNVEIDRRSGKDRRAISEKYYQFIKILRKIPIFNGLDINQFQRIVNICSKNIYKKNEKIFMEGEESHEIYILIDGELKVTFANGKELTRIKPVGIVGEMGIFTGEPRSASVAASTDCILLIMNRSEFFKLFERDYFLAFKILMNVIKDLSKKLRKNNIIIDELRQVALPGDYSKILSKTLMDIDEM